MANLSRWMEARGLGPRDLSRERAREFTAARRAAGRRSGRSLRSLAPVLTALAGAGALAPDPPAGPASEQERLLAAFGQYLRCERALAAGTAGAYVARAGRFLDGLGGSLDGLTAADVTARGARGGGEGVGGVGAVLRRRAARVPAVLLTWKATRLTWPGQRRR